jgi:hypothetical protein
MFGTEPFLENHLAARLYGLGAIAA